MWRRTNPLYHKHTSALRSLKRAAWARLPTELACLRADETTYRLAMGGLTLKERLDLVHCGHTRDKSEAKALLSDGLALFRKHPAAPEVCDA